MARPVAHDRFRQQPASGKAESRTFTLEGQIPLPAGYNWGDVGPLPSGELLVSAFGECSVYRWNPASPGIFTPEPVEPCDGSLGEGMIFPVGLAWGSTRQQFLARYDTSYDTTGTSPRGYGNALATLPLSLTRWTPWRVLSTDQASFDRFFTGMTYDSLLDSAVVARRGRAVEFPQPPLPVWAQTGTPVLLQVPMADPNLPLTTMELANGLMALGSSYVTFVTSGPQTGAIAVFDSEFQRLVVFRVK